MSATLTARNHFVGHVVALARPGVGIDEGLTRATRPRTAAIATSRRVLTVALPVVAMPLRPRKAAGRSFDFRGGLHVGLDCTSLVGPLLPTAELVIAAAGVAVLLTVVESPTNLDVAELVRGVRRSLRCEAVATWPYVSLLDPDDGAREMDGAVLFVGGSSESVDLEARDVHALRADPRASVFVRARGQGFDAHQCRALAARRSAGAKPRKT